MAARKRQEDDGVQLGSRDLTVGDSGDDVKALQALVLTEQTGEYDAVTERAVKVWQKANSRNPTGSIGGSERKLIARLLADDSGE